MNIQSKMPTTADEFLRWNEGREGKREFVHGRVVEMMINVTRNHVVLASNLMVALRQAAGTSCIVGSADFGVRTPAGIRYPDVFVDRKTDAAKGTDLTAVEPVLLAEILSPSSYARDFVDKLHDYRGIDSLRYYLIVSHEASRVWLISRAADNWSKPEEIAGMDGIVTLAELGGNISLGDLYEGVDLRPAS